MMTIYHTFIRMVNNKPYDIFHLAGSKEITNIFLMGRCCSMVDRYRYFLFEVLSWYFQFKRWITNHKNWVKIRNNYKTLARRHIWHEKGEMSSEGTVCSKGFLEIHGSSRRSKMCFTHSINRTLCWIEHTFDKRFALQK